MNESQQDEFLQGYEPPPDESGVMIRIAFLEAEILEVDRLFADEGRRQELTRREYAAWNRTARSNRYHWTLELHLLKWHLKRVKYSGLISKEAALKREVARRHAYSEELAARNVEVRRLIDAVEVLARPVRLLDQLNRLIVRHVKGSGLTLGEEDRAILEEARDFLCTTGNWTPAFNREPPSENKEG